MKSRPAGPKTGRERRNVEHLVRVLHGSDPAAAERAAEALRSEDKAPVVVSACLVGAPTRYDGEARLSAAVAVATRGRAVLPLCPELLGGMGCPRPPVHFAAGDGATLVAGGGRVVDDAGNDRGPELLAGARRALGLARLAGAREAILKERSPSCGCSRVHALGGIRAGTGVFAALARQAGLRCRSEEDV